MISWIKKLYQIVKNYDIDKNKLLTRIAQAEKIIKDRTNIHTNIHTDVHYKSDNQIIVIGRYKNRDYIQTFNVSSEDFPTLIKQLHQMERYGHVTRIDAPPMMRAVVERDF
jgi:hypothetical protein